MALFSSGMRLELSGLLFDSAKFLCLFVAYSRPSMKVKLFGSHSMKWQFSGQIVELDLVSLP